MYKFRIRLTTAFVLLIGLSVLAAGVFTAKLVENFYIHALKATMQRELQVILTAVDWKKTGTAGELTAYFSGRASDLKQSAGARVTFIQSDGKVLGDSDHDAATMDNHDARPEIIAAKAAGIGYAIRFSATLGQNMLYAAIPAPETGHALGYIRLAMSLADVEASIRRLWEFLGFGLLLLFLAAGIIGYRFAFGLTRPLEQITKVAQRITNNEYSARVTVRRKDEIGLLGKAINSMADGLQRQLFRISEDESRLKNVLDNMASGVIMIGQDGRIMLLNRAAEDYLGFTSAELIGRRYDEVKQQQEFAGFIRECMETRRRIRDELTFFYPEERMIEINVSTAQRENGDWSGVLVVLHDITAIRRLERMRSEFVANVSHELKTPIAAVKGFTETLLSGALDDEPTARQFLQIIFDESERLNRLIGDILDLSKIESRQIPLQFSPVEIKGFAERTLQMLQAEADKKRIALSLDVPEGLYVEADEDRLRQIVTNLVSNGISYTPEGGTVRFAAAPMYDGESTDYERIRFTVTDTGIGIPKKDLPRIFERFYRVDKARSRSSGGTGLGLSIVKHLVELHNGTIAVESTVGEGSTFMFELPVMQ